jgi:hypothetical protein
VKVTLKNIRCSFPSLVKKRGFGDDAKEEDKQYEFTSLIDPSTQEDQINTVKKAMKDLLIAHYGAAASVPKGFKYCLRNGSERPDTAGYEGMMFIGSNSKEKVKVVGLNPNIDCDPSEVYAGGHCNVVLRFWVQDNKYGKRVNAEVKTIQWLGYGERFGETPVNPAEEFEDLTGEDFGDQDTTGDGLDML